MKTFPAWTEKATPTELLYLHLLRNCKFHGNYYVQQLSFAKYAMLNLSQFQHVWKNGFFIEDTTIKTRFCRIQVSCLHARTSSGSDPRGDRYSSCVNNSEKISLQGYLIPLHDKQEPFWQINLKMISELNSLSLILLFTNVFLFLLLIKFEKSWGKVHLCSKIQSFKPTVSAFCNYYHLFHHLLSFSLCLSPSRLSRLSSVGFLSLGKLLRSSRHFQTGWCLLPLP